MNAASRAAGRYPGGTIVRLAIGKITPASKYALPRATARGKVAKIAGDASAKAVVERRQQPRALTDPVLGKLTLERELSWFSGKRATRGKRYEFSIEVDDPDRERTVERELARGRAALLRTERALPAIRDAVARKTLPLYNDNWRERRPKLSRTAFLGKIRLASIQVAPKRITVYFDPKQLFFGHVIEVRIRPNGKVSEVCLAG
jgi:hypothetical protein